MHVRKEWIISIIISGCLFFPWLFMNLFSKCGCQQVNVVKYFLAVTFTAKSCSLWVGRLWTGQVFVFKFIYYESSSRTLEKWHVQTQFPILSSLLKCFLSASYVYLKKINSSIFFRNTPWWNRVLCFLFNPSLNKISHDQSININRDKGNFGKCQYSERPKVSSNWN